MNLYDSTWLNMIDSSMENANLWINAGMGFSSAVHKINCLKRLMDNFTQRWERFIANYDYDDSYEYIIGICWRRV